MTKVFIPILTMLAVATTQTSQIQAAPKIDRQALVTRHNVTLTKFNGERPLQVGNGEFAFGMDITGLQSFAPFNTMSQWGWHSSPLPPGKRLEDYRKPTIPTHGRAVPYYVYNPAEPEISNWMMGNPHRINLGRIGMTLLKRDGSPAKVTDLQNTSQQLDLWTGIVTSRFTLEGEPVTVRTACYSSVDAVAAKIDSPLVAAKRLSVFLDFPGDDPSQFSNFVGDFNQTDPHGVRLQVKGQRADFARRFPGDATDNYHAALLWQGKANLVSPPKPAPALPLVIRKAEYGADARWTNVTAQLAAQVHDNRVDLRVENALFGDPAPQTPKTLNIEYSLGGKLLALNVGEGKQLQIQADMARPKFTLQPADGNSFSFVCAFSPKPLAQQNWNVDGAFNASRDFWRRFWQSGGAIDLSESRDPRWKELERRIVLSQYLMKSNEAGSLPPQESGLVNNGWFGRFHFEMIWWHAAHWALWNRWDEMEGNTSVYSKFQQLSRDLAKEQGYEGARWPKCTGPDGREWPHPIHAMLIWQQPHPIFFAELDYRAHPTKATLEKWRSIVEDTGAFMATYPFFDQAKEKYVLGPPMYPVSENTEPMSTQNPTYELSYWRFGLRVAQQWRQRLGLPRHAQWDKVLNGLSPLPTENGLYILQDSTQDMWTKWNFEHPALIGAYGMLPGDGVDKETMRRTFDKVSQVWDFNRTWGWDFPMLAMTAARLGEPERAVDFLLHPASGFQFDERGLATGGPFPYFPSNGALLYAVAQMAVGWDGAPKRHAPGFPTDGKWVVKFENLNVSP